MGACVERHREWIEEVIGCPLSCALTFEMDFPFSHVVLEDLMRDGPLSRQCLSAAPILRPVVARWDLPHDVSPRIELHPSRDRSATITAASAAWDPHWKDTPIAIWLRGLEDAAISIEIPYVSYLEKGAFSRRQWVIIRRDKANQFLKILCDIRLPRQITVIGGSPLPLPDAGYNWDTVVLDPSLNDIIRSDYEAFWKNEQWFRGRRLPYRRGYLLYGPPGNGKTTVARIMACHPLVTPFTIDFGDEGLPNAALSDLFQMAADTAPALIILEDLDRVFGAAPDCDNRTAITTAHLLNCLDGLGTRDGVVVVATANNPADLDPALLKRPGRFDRLAAFPSPSESLRLEYLHRLTEEQMDMGSLAKAGEESAHCSFAQIRESYILAAQSAFLANREIECDDLIEAIRRVKGDAIAARSRMGAAGFGTCAPSPAPRLASVSRNLDPTR
jgi:hypothetical protein